MFEPIEVADLPSSDKVYRCSESGRYVKTRIVRPDDSSHAPDMRAKNLFLHLSGSACDADGWALPDGEGGHCIAPERTLTESVALLRSQAQAANRTLAEQLLVRFEELRLECCLETIGIDEAIALKMAIPTKALTASDAPAAVPEPPPELTAIPAALAT